MELLLMIVQLEQENSFNNSVFIESIRFEPVEIDLMNEKTDIVIGNRYERLAFERAMRNRKECFLQVRLTI